MNESKNANDPSKVKILEEVSGLIDEALRNYEYYRTGDDKFLREDWLKNYSFIFRVPGLGDIGKSPLNFLAYLISTAFLSWLAFSKNEIMSFLDLMLCFIRSRSFKSSASVKLR